MGDNPKTVQNDTKKTEPDDRILSDLDDSTADIECDTCGITFTDANAYESHMQGKKHQKKVAEAKLMAKNLAAGKKKEPESEEEEDDDDRHCDVCDKNFSGYISYVAHMKGSVHAKNVKKMKLKQQLGDRPEVLDDKDDSDDDGILPRPYARCDFCHKEFSGPEPYKMHISSAVHKKKLKQSQAMQSLKAKHEEDGTKKASDDDDEDLFSKCDVCQKSFSGVVPYKIHMQSGAHKRNLEKRKVAEEIKEFRADGDDPSSGYICRECKKCFTDPLAFKSHMANNSHEKQKAKGALKEFLNDHPEIVFVHPLDDKEGGGSVGNESDSDEESDYYLICKLCHVSFSGPESAKDHVKSKRHLAAKKEKKMMKLLKEKEKSDDKKSLNGKVSSEPSSKEISENGKLKGYKKSQNLQDSKPSSKEISEIGKPKSPVTSHENHEHDFELI